MVRRQHSIRRRLFGDLFGGSEESQAPPPTDPNLPFHGGPYAPEGFATESMKLEIVRYPHPALRCSNAPVEAFDGRLRQLCDNLFKAMYAEGDGIGLAAPQVGVNLRVMVYNPEPGNPDEETVFINPRITDMARGYLVEKESCLSFPRISGPVKRPAWVEVEAADWDGCPFRRTIDGFEARLFQHEYDHLDGIVYIDHLADSARAAIQPDLDFFIQDYIKAGGTDPAL